MKKFVYVLLVVFLSGCVVTSGPSHDDSLVMDGDFDKWAKSDFYEVYLNPDDDVLFYFEYPVDAVFSGNKFLSYNGCDVFFGTEFSIPAGLIINEKNSGGVVNKAGFKGEDFVFYLGVVDEYSYGFWVESADVSVCTSFVDRIAESFTDDFIYNGEGYSFSIPEGFKVENMADKNMVVMKKWVEAEEFVNEEGEDDFIDGYAVEFSVFTNENLLNFEDLNAYVAHDYPGYNLEFPDEECVCVDEMSGDNAFRHFLKMSDDGDYVYEAQLKVPTFHYGLYSEAFDEFANSIMFE